MFDRNYKSLVWLSLLWGEWRYFWSIFKIAILQYHFKIKLSTEIKPCMVKRHYIDPAMEWIQTHDLLIVSKYQNFYSTNARKIEYKFYSIDSTSEEATRWSNIVTLELVLFFIYELSLLNHFCFNHSSSLIPSLEKFPRGIASFYEKTHFTFYHKFSSSFFYNTRGRCSKRITTSFQENLHNNEKNCVQE